MVSVESQKQAEALVDWVRAEIGNYPTTLETLKGKIAEACESAWHRGFTDCKEAFMLGWVQGRSKAKSGGK